MILSFTLIPLFHFFYTIFILIISMLECATNKNKPFTSKFQVNSCLDSHKDSRVDQSEHWRVWSNK